VRRQRPLRVPDAYLQIPGEITSSLRTMLSSMKECRLVHVLATGSCVTVGAWSLWRPSCAPPLPTPLQEYRVAAPRPWVAQGSALRISRLSDVDVQCLTAVPDVITEPMFPLPRPNKQVPMLPKLRAQSPDYREAASHYSAHDAVR
jgi:hypothetical protein